MLTAVQINFLNSVCPYRWTECNGIVNVNGDVYLSYKDLTRIPVQFGQVNGNFDCSHNKLTTLKETPTIIYGDFNCKVNFLTSLEGGPKEVTGYYNCSDNLLTNLIGAPEICNDNFYCCSNKLTSLEGCPIVKNVLDLCYNSKLEYIWGVVNNIPSIRANLCKIAEDLKTNIWICQCIRDKIVFPYYTLEENIQWMRSTIGLGIYLKNSTEYIKKNFSSYELNYINNLA